MSSAYSAMQQCAYILLPSQVLYIISCMHSGHFIYNVAIVSVYICYNVCVINNFKVCTSYKNRGVQQKKIFQLMIG